MSVESLAAELRPAYHSGALLLGRLGAVSLLPLALAVTLHLAKLAALGRAWHNIVRAAYPADRVGFPEALAAFLAGVGVGALVPSRVGELVRLGLLRARLASSTFPGLVSTVLAEQVFDMVLKALVVAVALAVGFRAGVAGSASLIALVVQHPLTATGAAAAAAVAAGGARPGRPPPV